MRSAPRDQPVLHWQTVGKKRHFYSGRARGTVHVMENVPDLLTTEQAYETAFRFVWQYYQREPSSESLALMLVAMEPVSDTHRTNDPASWDDWQRCVEATVTNEPLPGFQQE
jgi:hypothetical protein